MRNFKIQGLADPKAPTVVADERETPTPKFEVRVGAKGLPLEKSVKFNAEGFMYAVNTSRRSGA